MVAVAYKRLGVSFSGLKRTKSTQVQIYLREGRRSKEKLISERTNEEAWKDQTNPLPFCREATNSKGTTRKVRLTFECSFCCFSGFLFEQKQHSREKRSINSTNSITRAAVNEDGVKRSRAIRKECPKLTCSVAARPHYRNNSRETEEDKQLVWHSEAAPLFSHTHRVFGWDTCSTRPRFCSSWRSRGCQFDFNEPCRSRDGSPRK